MNELKPCSHTKRWLPLLVKGRLHGIVLWYLRMHVKRCGNCTEAVEALRAAEECIESVRREAATGPSELSPERMAVLDELFLEPRTNESQ